MESIYREAMLQIGFHFVCDLVLELKQGRRKEGRKEGGREERGREEGEGNRNFISLSWNRNSTLRLSTVV